MAFVTPDLPLVGFSPACDIGGVYSPPNDLVLVIKPEDVGFQFQWLYLPIDRCAIFANLPC